MDGLRALGCRDLRPGFSGVHVLDATMELIYRVNYCSRFAGRVLQPLARFRCPSRDALYKGIGEVAWSPLIPPGKTFAIDANVTHKALRNSLFAAQVAKDAICDQLRSERDVLPLIRKSRMCNSISSFASRPRPSIWIHPAKL